MNHRSEGNRVVSFFHHFLQIIRDYIFNRLETPRESYRHRIYNDLNKLYEYIRKGDVVLVEGRSEMSTIIKLFSKSHWSHVAFYVGDKLIKEDHPFRDRYLDEFGSDANHLVVEAFTGKGVIASPLRKYRDYNIRVCRPYGILPKDLKTVIEKVISNLGKHYDEQNIIDIALMLLPFRLNPFKRHAVNACLGKCNDFQVICSGMIAQSFQHIGYPIVPAFKTSGEEDKDFQKNPFGSELIMRHFSQIMPRDFDLSPNFQIIKFNIIETGEFDYKSLHWRPKIE
ncbi:MAG TPA: hypothetical protein ENI07_16735 [Desulfobacterales bacterium]|nr:hypothetical protein [Desulfobacterales bacterium]